VDQKNTIGKFARRFSLVSLPEECCVLVDQKNIGGKFTRRLLVSYRKSVVDKWARITLLASLPEDFLGKFTGRVLCISGAEERCW